MKMVKSLLLGSAAGLVAVAGAQAADLPVKAKPVEYVKVCSLYGAGFFYIPGTDTCIKLGGAIRVQAEANTGGGGIVVGTGGAEAVQGRFTRSDTNDVNFRNRIFFSVDTRNQTEYGTLRSYFRMGIQQTTPTDPAGGAVFWDRAFIQFAGFTVGHTQSFYDIYTFGGAQTYLNVRTIGDTGAAGLTVWAYTAQFGNGVSATLSAEDPGGHNRMPVVDFSAAGAFGVGTAVTDTAFANQTGTNNGFRMPDIIGNLRIDQAWGYAAISGAIHEVGGAYYGVDSTPNGHPGDKIGWAIGVGGLINTSFIAAGDKIGAMFNYAQGANGYTQNANSFLMFKGGTSVGFGNASDGVFDCPLGIVTNGAGTGCPSGTSIELTTSWSINAGYEHLWTPALRTTFYGGYAEVDYNGTAKGIINSRTGLAAAGVGGPACTTAAAAAPGGATFTGFTPLVGNSCNPNFSFYQIGARTQWNPHRDLDIGLDVVYTHLNTAYKGPANISAQGAQPGCAAPACASSIDDQNVWSAMFRWQRNFLP